MSDAFFSPYLLVVPVTVVRAKEVTFIEPKYDMCYQQDPYGCVDWIYVLMEVGNGQSDIVMSSELITTRQ